MRQKLTEVVVTKTKPHPSNTIEIWDTHLSGFGVRILPKPGASYSAEDGWSGTRTFFLMYRAAGGKQRRLGLGKAAPKQLGPAREKAREALRAVERGEDPQQTKVERRKNTFGVIAEQFIKECKRKDAREVEQIIRRELLGQVLDADNKWINGSDPVWRDKPAADITPQDAARLIRAIKNRGSPPRPGQRRRKSGGAWAAHHVHAVAKTVFNWAIAQHEYGLTASPFDRLKPRELIGEKKARQRVLSDAELRTVWEAALSTPYPYGHLVRALMLTGQRLTDIAEMRWPEIDWTNALLSIPPERMKKDAAHEVPLAPAMVALLRSLPRPAAEDKKGDFVFTTTDGARPFSGFSKEKKALDEKIAALRAEARAGKDAKPEKGDELPNWTCHDLRRTYRTRLSELRITDTVAELCIAHQKRGLHKVYDQHAYRDEKRDAMERWAVRLAAIVSPPADNVVAFDRAVQS